MTSDHETGAGFDLFGSGHQATDQMDRKETEAALLVYPEKATEAVTEPDMARSLRNLAGDWVTP